MSNSNDSRVTQRGSFTAEEQLAPPRRPLAGQSARDATDDLASARATIGGFDWEWLPSAAREQWLHTIRDFAFPRHDRRDWAEFRTLSRQAAAAILPQEVIDLSREFARPGGHDAIVIDNLPVDVNLGPTPPDGQRPSQKKAVSEAVITGIVECMGYEVFSYQQEKQGELFHQLVPVSGQEDKQSNTGRAKFDFHTDNANIPTRFRQECLGLFGLRNENYVSTMVITIEDLKHALPYALLQKLRYPIYRLPAPLSFDLADWTVLSEPRPIIWTDDGGIDRIALPRSDFAQADPEAEEAIGRLRALLDTMEPRRVVVSPGRFLAFRDNRVLHGRDKVVGDRWLQRVYFSRMLDCLRAATNSNSGEFSFDVRLLMMK